MKLQKTLVIFATLALICALGACSGKKGGKQETSAPSAMSSMPTKMNEPVQMPSRYQNPGYLASRTALGDDLGDTPAEFQIRVGATIKSTSGPQPLWDVLKRLANLKGMTVSWASDVDQNYLVDVDINAQDLFQDAVANLLRQADYFYEMNGKTIVVKNKTTKVFHVGVPYVKGNYTSNVGGNFLPKQKGGTLDTEGTVKLQSDKNEYDLWTNIQKNLDVILDVAAAERAALAASKEEAAARAAAEEAKQTGQPQPVVETKVAAKKDEGTQRAEDGGFYVVDKAVGTITVTAKPSVMATVERYFEDLKRQIYRQIAIEAKIIEVILSDRSKIGIDWSSVLENFNINGVVRFGDPTFSKVKEDGKFDPNSLTNVGRVYTVAGLVNNKLVRDVGLADLNFSALINALDQQGRTKILSNPKLTVLNGQPALISVGTVTKYISEVEREEDDNNRVTYSVETDSVTEGVSMGVIATIIDDHNMIMQLTPITSELVGGVINKERIGDNQEMSIGLPVINMREMSTTVRVGDGEMLIIGGLIDSMQANNEKFAPVVGKIPIIKYLFGYEEKETNKRELVILLAPKIL
nr:pilus (MSHA type) biogenesis protein MshL [uncultured Streptococcus sp.]